LSIAYCLLHNIKHYFPIYIENAARIYASHIVCTKCISRTI